MDKTSKLLGLVLAVLVVAFGAQPAASATSIPLVVGTAADDVIVNFDFSSESVPPPYTNTILSFFHINVSTVPTKVAFDYYDELNGVGLLGTDISGPTLTTTGSWNVGTGCPAATAFCAGVLDGTFSIGLHLTEGAAEFSDAPGEATALAFNLGSENPDAGVDGTLGTRAVPEPATLMLLGFALAGIGLTRARRS